MNEILEVISHCPRCGQELVKTSYLYEVACPDFHGRFSIADFQDITPSRKYSVTMIEWRA